jgi:dethiobiotin synthetase
MTTLFVTGTGTGVGKTFVTKRLIAELRALRRSVRALKPVASGFDDSRPEASDTGELLHALGVPLTREAIDASSPWRFAAPLSPDMAAALEGRVVPFDDVVDFCRAPSAADVTLIEGIGGVMVPLDGEHTVLDWIAAVEAPVVLVAGSYLGTLSHTLTAAAVLRERACTLAAVVVSESAEQPVPSTETAAVLGRFLQPAVVAIVPRDASARSGATLLPQLTEFLA